MLGHQNQVNLIMLSMALMVDYGEEAVEHHKNLLVLDLQHKAIFMVIHMRENVLTQNLIGFLKVSKKIKLVILDLAGMVQLASN